MQKGDVGREGGGGEGTVAIGISSRWREVERWGRVRKGDVGKRDGKGGWVLERVVLPQGGRSSQGRGAEG